MARYTHYTASWWIAGGPHCWRTYAVGITYKPEKKKCAQGVARRRRGRLCLADPSVEGNRFNGERGGSGQRRVTSTLLLVMADAS